MTDSPKTHPTDNAEKPPKEWVTGSEPMTGAQTSYLKTLSEQHGHPEAFADDLTKAEASMRIDALKDDDKLPGATGSSPEKRVDVT